MEQKNKVEIAGVVARARTLHIGSTSVLKMVVVSQAEYHMDNGQQVIENTWSDVTAFYRKGMPDFTLFSAGTKVSLTGRLRCTNVTRADGSSVISHEIVASSLEILCQDDFPAEVL